MTSIKRKYRGPARLLAAFSVALMIFSLLATMVSVAPAAADKPWSSNQYLVIDCYANPESAACLRLNAAPTCGATEKDCFNKINSSEDQATWWLNMGTGEICKGTDFACLATYPGDDWVFDHSGASPEVEGDEQTPIEDQYKGGNDPEQTNGGQSIYDPTADDSCGKVVNELKICNIVTVTNGLQFYALAMCMAGIFISGGLWAAGSHGQNPGQELTGKKGLIVCVTAAFVVGASTGLVSWLDHQSRSSDFDNSGITSVTNPN